MRETKEKKIDAQEMGMQESKAQEMNAHKNNVQKSGHARGRWAGNGFRRWEWHGETVCEGDTRNGYKQKLLHRLLHV